MADDQTRAEARRIIVEVRQEIIAKLVEDALAKAIDAHPVETEGCSIEWAARRYNFRLPPGATDRCFDCRYVMMEEGSEREAHCALLQIHIAHAWRSRCPRHEAKP